MKVVILAAGRGTRLGNPLPKTLTQLADGTTILQRQIAAFSQHVPLENICVVVGHGKEQVIAACPGVMHAYNPRFAETNTAKSLLCALERVEGEDVVWANGDVVFDPEVVQRVVRHRGSCVAVNTARVAEEEVKYRISPETGAICEISKEVVGGAGEAVGINKVAAKSLDLLRRLLRECADNNYFEKAIELAIAEGLEIYPADISDLFCVEIDFPEDLARANQQLQQGAARWMPLVEATLVRDLPNRPQDGLRDYLVQKASTRG